jgi:hypothetical protein
LILDNGDQFVAIHEYPNPEGVYIEIGSPPRPPGDAPATIGTPCAPESVITLGWGDALVLTCGSLSLQVLSGPVEALLVGDDSSACKGEVSLDTGYSLSFDPETCSFSAGEDNPGPVDISIGGNTILVDPGSDAELQHVNVAVNPGSKPPSTINIKKDRIITVVLFGQPGLDVTTDIDYASLLFGPDMASAVRYSFAKIDKDAYVDLVLKFELFSTGISSDQTSACVTGILNDGATPIHGCAPIIVINK